MFLAKVVFSYQDLAGRCLLVISASYSHKSMYVPDLQMFGQLLSHSNNTMYDTIYSNPHKKRLTI